MPRYALSEASWPVVLAFGLMGTLTVSLTNTGHALSGELLAWAVAGHAPADCLPKRPLALVVTKNDDIQGWVSLTVGPRGYRVVPAQTAGSAREILRSDAFRIGVIVLDPEVQEAEAILALMPSPVPAARLIRLRPHPDATEVSKLLVDVL